MKPLLLFSIALFLLAGVASADDSNYVPPPVQQPQVPLPSGVIGNWCLWESVDHDLLLSPRATPSVVTLRIPYTSNGWMWVGTRKAQAVFWTVGNFSEQQFDREDDKRSCGNTSVAPGSYSVQAWTLNVSATQLSVSHRDNQHRFVVDAASNGVLQIVGASGGDFAVTIEDALPPSSAPNQAPGP